ncbi:odorant receptor 10-like [Battus philenor]|uniref:odorant receptor 10-like n=1 Tax=Battus philenor TaxID=42288 RepID=UPI0035CE9763
MLEFLENPLYPSLGPHLKLLGLTGIWRPEPKSSLTRFKSFIFYVTICYFLSQYVKCAIDFNKQSFELIMHYAPFHIGIVKSCFFLKDYAKWNLLIDYLSLVERKQIEENKKEEREIMKDYITRNRRVTCFFWTLAFLSNFSIFSEPYQKNRTIENGTSIYLNIFDGYTPFSREPPGYYGSMAIQTILGHVVSAYVVGWDTMVVCIMIYFAGQLKISRLYAKQTITNDLIQSHGNIEKCHKFYIELIKHHKIFASLIYSIMFIYLIVISINLGICIIQIVEVQDDLATLISSCMFVVACLIQLLLFYWFSNEVTLESLNVCYGVYESDWISCNNKIKKELYLLGLSTRKKLVFKAGPFNAMSLTTFVSILRTSYSFYTLLNKTN